MAATYTPEERAHWVAVYLEHGLAETCRRSRTENRPRGIPKATLTSWVVKAGHDPAEINERTGAKTRAATAAVTENLAARKAEFAAALMGDLKKLRAQLFAPCVERRVVTLSGGKDNPATWEIVEVARDKPTFADQVKILTSIGIAVDKVQILTGAATDRIDITGDVRARAAELADELAQRRARKAS